MVGRKEKKKKSRKAQSARDGRLQALAREEKGKFMPL